RSGTRSMQPSFEELAYIILHVFLPLNLPHEYDINSPHKDCVLLNYVLTVARGFRRALELIGNDGVLSILSTWDVVIKMLD
ncbi:1085_t:CDS:1, partial [Acaulospora colombiana]